MQYNLILQTAISMLCRKIYVTPEITRHIPAKRKQNLATGGNFSWHVFEHSDQ